MWYVIQIKTGREEIVRQWMKSIIPPSLYDDCRVILYETKRKVQGEWQIEKKRAFPGYLFLITSQIEEMRSYLRQIPELTKVLGYDGEIVALSSEEEELIKHLSGSDEIIELSYGIQIGDKVTITEGPLIGMESIIYSSAIELDLHCS